MITVKLDVDVTHLERIPGALKALQEIVPRWADEEVRPFVEQETERRLGKAPGDVHYPIEWTSEKQRMAFFASKGFGHGIPYSRTGKLVLAWGARTDVRNDVTSIAVYNDAPAATYVYGDNKGEHQQQFHLNTGWLTFVEQVEGIAAEASAWAVDSWGAAVDQLIETGRYGG